MFNSLRVHHMFASLAIEHTSRTHDGDSASQPLHMPGCGRVHMTITPILGLALHTIIIPLPCRKPTGVPCPDADVILVIARVLPAFVLTLVDTGIFYTACLSTDSGRKHLQARFASFCCIYTRQQARNCKSNQFAHTRWS